LVARPHTTLLDRHHQHCCSGTSAPIVHRHGAEGHPSISCAQAGRQPVLALRRAPSPPGGCRGWPAGLALDRGWPPTQAGARPDGRRRFRRGPGALLSSTLIPLQPLVRCWRHQHFWFREESMEPPHRGAAPPPSSGRPLPGSAPDPWPVRTFFSLCSAGGFPHNRAGF